MHASGIRRENVGEIKAAEMDAINEFFIGENTKHAL